MKTAYLTIDDAPSDDFRKKVDFLTKNNIPAIFYCRGDNLEKHEEDAIYAIKKGFVIGNHSYSHAKFAEISKKDAFEQIKKTDEIIEKLYDKAKLKAIKVFRYPYGKKSKFDSEVQNLLRKLSYVKLNFESLAEDDYPGKIDALWTFDTEDWVIKNFPGSESYVLMRAEILCKIALQKRPNFSEIVLMHDHVHSTEQFFKVIDIMLSYGLKFKLPNAVK